MVNFFCFIIGFAIMEFVAWFSHKYVMHGFLWKWHKVHHQNAHPEQFKLDKNDLFFLIYAIPAIILIIFGLFYEQTGLVYLGAGITLYGFTYFFFHDIVYHQRIKMAGSIQNNYFKALIRAHNAHHHPDKKQVQHIIKHYDSYGLLIFSKKFFNSER